MKNKNEEMQRVLDETKQTGLADDHHNHSNENKDCCGDCKGKGSCQSINIKNTEKEMQKEFKS